MTHKIKLLFFAPLSVAFVGNVFACFLAINSVWLIPSGAKIRPMSFSAILLSYTVVLVITTWLVSRYVIHRCAMGRKVPIFGFSICVLGLAISLAPIPLASYVLRKYCIINGIVID
jgi:hypothetical protein